MEWKPRHDPGDNDVQYCLQKVLHVFVTRVMAGFSGVRIRLRHLRRGFTAADIFYDGRHGSGDTITRVSYYQYTRVIQMLR